MRFPWDQMMQMGLGRLHLSPDQFWSMSPHELSAAIKGLLGPVGSTPPMNRADLDQLLARFPDPPSPNKRSSNQ